jgi:hypothetical protein
MPKPKKADENARFQHRFFVAEIEYFCLPAIRLYIKQADNRGFIYDYRLCALASGSFLI